jgi:hypothetical protein
MRYFVAVLALAIASNSYAEFYVGGNAGAYLYDQNVDVTSSSDVEIRDYALGVHAGYMLRDWIGAEVAYLNYLEGGETLGNDEVILRAKGESVSLTLRPAWRISQDFELFAKLGVAFWDADLRYRVPALELEDKVSDDGSDFTWGAGGRWWGGEHWSLALEFDRIQADTEVQFDTVTFNIAYHF